MITAEGAPMIPDRHDVLMGGWWIDRLYGGAGNDSIDGVGADDRINGGRGTDSCVRSPVIRKCE